MTQEERQKWIDAMIQAGAHESEAIEWVDMRVEVLPAVGIPFVMDLAICITRSMKQVETRRAVERLWGLLKLYMPDTPTEPESPPVEIPRRVVMVGATYKTRVGSIGTVIEKVNGQVCVLFDGDDEWQYVRNEALILLQLSDEERARLLLEQLSREANQRDDTDGEECFYIDVFGAIRSVGRNEVGQFVYPKFAPDFPNHAAATAAREAIIRAGLAWWKVEG